MPDFTDFLPWTRRNWLLAAASGLFAAGRPSVAAATADLDTIRKRAATVGLGPLGTTFVAPYLAIGDAPERFRAQAAAICKDLSRAYLDHFRSKKFAVIEPTSQLVIVTLAGPDSYEKFTGEKLDGPVGGHYDRDRNYLVMFDFREDPAKDNALAIRSNRFTLVHEAMHQLTFNTGLLDLDGDVPAAISEGLGVYSETWAEGPRRALGGPNDGRKQGLIQGMQQGNRWIPVSTLLADDAPLQGGNPSARQLAYAESGLLIRALMAPARLPMLRDYLAAIRPRRDSAKRVADATASFGNLEKLDADVRKLAGIRVKPKARQ